MSAPKTVSGPSIETLQEQEVRLVLGSFTNDDAWELGNIVRDLARERGAPVAIDITRGGQQLFHAALAGSAPDNDGWIDRKRRVVERYHASSYLVGSRFRAKGTTFEESARLDTITHAAHGGAFPISVRGVGFVGVIVVSGLPQVHDHELVVEALERFIASR